MEQRLAAKWFKDCLLLLGCLMLLTAGLTIFIDPYFHYHKPFSFLSYRLYDERYINDGISRNFDYDAIITGTSMSQNFKTSEANALFGVNAVKEPFSGAGYQELYENLDRALTRKKDIKMVIMAVDYNGLLREADWSKYDGYPTYLYDDHLLNDVSYVFNKSILYHGTLNNVVMSLKKEPSTTMDEYASWQKETGLEHILASYCREDVKPDPNPDFSQQDYELVTSTVEKNITALAEKYPDTTFYLYYTPYSICYWDALSLKGTVEKQLEAEKTATELMLQYSNIKLYNFFDREDVICNLSFYNDDGHYSAEISSEILRWMSEDSGLVTEENYLDRLNEEKQFFLSYDYDMIYR